MPKDESTPTPRFRWDPAGLIAAMGGFVVLLAVVIRIIPVSCGDAIDAVLQTVAGPLTVTLGYAAVPAVIAWLMAAIGSIRRSSFWSIERTLLGWLVLTATLSVIADSTIRSSVSIYGAGGSIGAYLTTLLDRFIDVPVLRVLTVAALLVLSGSLIAPVAIAKVLKSLVAAVRWVIALLKPLLSRQHSRQETIALVPANALSRTDPPVLKIAEFAESDPELLTPGEIPIHSHVKPEEAMLRVVPIDEAGEQPVETRSYNLPSLEHLADADPFPVQDHEVALRERAQLLEKTFADFGLAVKVVGIHTGPVITQYEVALETGLRLNKVTALSDDLALNLRVASVRVVAPLPGRNTVGIEVPNEHRQTVKLKELIVATHAKASRFRLPIFLGKDVEGRPLTHDLAAMPHLLIAGRTGTGKSVCLNSIILSLLYTRTPDDCRLILIDPKKVELSEYGKLPHLMHPVVTDDRKAEAIIAWAVDAMEKRYEWLRKARVRNVASYNELGWDEIVRRVDPPSEDERKAIPRSLPSIVLVIDEVGDLIMRNKKEIEGNIILIAQKSRAAGIHLILATQKPTVDVITGLIKSNLPARICFQVASRSDSAVVLDEKGAEKLLGMGDMLFLQPGTSSIVRAQGAYVSDLEIARTVAELECDQPNYEAELLNLKAKDDGGASLGESLRDRDPMYEQAIEVVIREQRGSTSLLQRALGIGYGRASRLIDFMAEDGLVGGYNGSNAREVLVTPEEWNGRKAG